MDSIVLITAGVILALAAFRGYRAGMVRMVLAIVTLIVTVVLTGLLLRPVSLLVKENTSLYDNIQTSVLEVIDEYDISDSESLKNLPFPEYVLDNIDTVPDAVDDFKMMTARAVTDQIFHALIYVCLNIVIYVILRIIMGAFNVVTRLPVVKELNKLAGFLLGLAEGIIFLWLLCLLLQACGSEEWAQEIFVQINESSLLSWIYNHNMVADFLGKLV